MTKQNGSLVLPLEIPGDLTITTESDGDHLSLDGFHHGGASGTPELPSYRFTFLVPEDIVPGSLRITLADDVWKDIDGIYDVAPIPPLATGNGSGVIVRGRNQSIYSSNDWYPDTAFHNIHFSQYRQWHLLRFHFYPVRYHPVTGRLRLFRSGTVVIHYETVPSVSRKLAPNGGARTYPRSDRFWQRIAPDIENPQHRDEFYPRASSRFAPSPIPNPDYVIITTHDIATDSTVLDSFVSNKESRGFTVAVITEGAGEDDDHYLSGSTAQERAENIRQWLASRYTSWGIEYVLLIGDPYPASTSSNESIAMRYSYPCAVEHGEEAPTDLYYADLTGNWDKDGDGYPGEYPDDYGSGGADGDCEVAVGRIPYYGDIAETDGILQKTIDYETASGNQSWRDKLLIAAAISNHAPEDHNGDGDYDDDGEPSERTYGDDWGEDMEVLGDGNGCTTYTLYEQDGCYDDIRSHPTTVPDASLTVDNLSAAWQTHYGYVAWWGHGSTFGAYRRVWENDEYDPPGDPAPYDEITQHDEETTCPVLWDTTHCTELDDDYPSFVVQVSCLNGYPEYSTNLGYALLKNGAVGTLSASRVSWYYIGSWSPELDGDNASYAYYLYERMLKNGDTVGNALGYCKSTLDISVFWQLWMNKCVFNLYGDPSLTTAVTQNTDDPYEENDTLATAHDFTATETWLSTISGLATMADDDWYRITPGNAEERRIQVDCLFTHDDGNIDIELCDADGAVLRDSNTTTNNESLHYVVPTTGTYYIHVTGDKAGNNYDLWWNDLPTPLLPFLPLLLMDN